MQAFVNQLRKECQNMRKTGLILSLSLVLVLLSSAAALAAANPHGGYTTNTASCAQCHKTHTASSRYLIAFTLPAGTQNDIYRTCTYCHSYGGSSHYNEVDGWIQDGTNVWGTSAGGFQNMGIIEGANSYAKMIAVTSKHDVDAVNSTLVAIPGGSTNANGKIELRCDSCHDPHGTPNSRQLVPIVTVFNAASTSWQTVNTTPTGQTISMTIGNPASNETVTYNDNNINTFCGACHTDYLQTAHGSGGKQSGTYTTGLYRHRVGVTASFAPGYNATYLALPTTTTGYVICLTCHYAHGTTANVSPETYANGSNLLRMDERGVCQNCHRKTFSTTQPTVLGSPNSYQVSASDKNHVVLTFNTYMEKISVQTATNYTVTGGTGITVTGAVLQVNGTLGKIVVLTLSGSLTPGTGYTITVNPATVQDLNGKTVSASGNTFAFTSL